MSERICPSCKVIYTNGQQECEECGAMLKTATEEELCEQRKNMSKKLSKASNKSESITPDLWQIIAAAVLVVYGITILVLFGKVHASLLILNIIYAGAILIPKFLEAKGYHKCFNFTARDPLYTKIERIIALCFIALCNIIYTYQLIFQA